MVHKSEYCDTQSHIIKHAVFLFAKYGYNGVSMRDLSKVVGVSTAALYHHFKDKEALYIEVMSYAFKDKAEAIVEALNAGGNPQQRLENFLERFIFEVGADPDFRALVQWELLDNDEIRLRMVAERVFLEPFKGISQLSEELAPEMDPHMLAVSIIGLVMFHFETASMRRFLPGWQSEQIDLKKLPVHLNQLLIRRLCLSAEHTVSNDS